MNMMYKLVTQEWTTHGGMKWALGKTNKAVEPGNKMCSAQVLHCYKTPEQAAFLNPIHASINNPILLEIDCSEIINTDQLKFACKEQTPIRIIPMPVLTTEDRVKIAILVAKPLTKNNKWLKWADSWLANTDRSRTAAADYAAYTAADAAAAAADYAAYAADDAAYTAADYAAYAADYAAYAAYDAAYTAADAAAAAADAYSIRGTQNFNTTLQNIITSVIKEK